MVVKEQRQAACNLRHRKTCTVASPMGRKNEGFLQTGHSQPLSHLYVRSYRRGKRNDQQKHETEKGERRNARNNEGKKMGKKGDITGDL